jgi:hypothetical protein
MRTEFEFSKELDRKIIRHDLIFHAFAGVAILILLTIMRDSHFFWYDVIAAGVYVAIAYCIVASAHFRRMQSSLYSDSEGISFVTVKDGEILFLTQQEMQVFKITSVTDVMHKATSMVYFGDITVRGMNPGKDKIKKVSKVTIPLCYAGMEDIQRMFTEKI